MSLWGIIVAAGLITFAIRLSFIVALERWNIPEWFRRALRFVPAAVLTAILVPELVSWNGSMDLSWRNPQIFAGLAAALVAWRTRSILFTIAVGLAAFVLLLQ